MDRFDEAALQEVRESRLILSELDRWLFGLIRPFIGQRILEVGCGLGNMITYLLDRELIIGVDISESAVEQMNDKYKKHFNVRAKKLDVVNPEILQLEQHKFDTAISINVLEHIENDTLALSHILKLLVPGGCLILIIPAHMVLYGRMDSSIGHYRRYDLENLSTKLTQIGFDVQMQRYLNPLGALGWYINGRLLGRKVPPRGQLKLFNQLMPLVIALENRLKFPFGLSLFSVSQRP